MPLRYVSVFCGSHLGNRPSFAAAATGLGHALAARNIGLVYGGASVGLMGVIADAVLAAGGRVIGVITESLSDHEIAHGGLARLDVSERCTREKPAWPNSPTPSSCCLGASVRSRNSWRRSQGATRHP